MNAYKTPQISNQNKIILNEEQFDVAVASCLVIDDFMIAASDSNTNYEVNYFPFLSFSFIHLFISLLIVFYWILFCRWQCQCQCQRYYHWNLLGNHLFLFTLKLYGLQCNKMYVDKWIRQKTLSIILFVCFFFMLF